MNKILKTRRYTIVEILVVIGLMAILMGIASAGISAITAKRGINGGVSIVSSQINLARSIAVSKTRYVALLIPSPPYSGNMPALDTKLKPLSCTHMRLCYVRRSSDVQGAGHSDECVEDFVFDEWIEDYGWTKLPTKVCVNLIDGEDDASIESPDKPSYHAEDIGKVEIEAGEVNCAGIIFSPSGRLTGSLFPAMIQVYPALVKDGIPEMLALGNSTWANQDDGLLKYRRWCVNINPFTGRSEVNYAQPKK